MTTIDLRHVTTPEEAKRLMDEGMAPLRALKDRPDYCLLADHRWSGWSDWRPIQRPLGEPRLDDQPPKLEPILAVRDRQCGRCGAREGEDYQGKREMIDDPSGIERRIEREGRRPPVEVRMRWGHLDRMAKCEHGRIRGYCACWEGHGS